MSKKELTLKRNQPRTKRRTETKSQKIGEWLLICEGIETEVNYFTEVIKDINKRLDIKKKIKCEIHGEGIGTTNLVKKAEQLLSYVDKHNKKSKEYSKIFIAFDKDSFSPSAFNGAIEKCQNSGFIPLWSNEAIEYWFLLHFNYIEGHISRIDYEKKINECFKQVGSKHKYQKNDPKIYQKLCELGSLEKAMINARKIHNKLSKVSPAKAVSCTTVYKFFDEIDETIKEVN